MQTPRSNHLKAKFFVSLVVLNTVLFGHGGDFSIPWHTVDGGGGTSTSGDGRFSVSGTAGQPDAGHLAGDGFDLSGGFWQRVAACDCYLTIQRVGDNIVVTWPATFAGCTLQTTTELRAPVSTTVWTPVTAVLVSGTYTYTAPVADTARFFRLSGF